MATLGGNLLQRTRCAYFRGGEPFACNKRKPGSGCAAQQASTVAMRCLAEADACIAVYPGDLAVALVAFDAKIDVLADWPAHHRRGRASPRAGSDAECRDHAQIRRIDPTYSCAQDAMGRASTYHKIRDREFLRLRTRLRGRRAGHGWRHGPGSAHRYWRARHAALASPFRGTGPCRQDALRREPHGRPAMLPEGAKPGRDNAFRIELGARTVADALMIARQRA